MPAKHLCTCSFCGKSKKEVRQIIVATERTPVVSICNECVAICTRIIANAPPPKD